MIEVTRKRRYGRDCREVQDATRPWLWHFVTAGWPR